MEKENLIDIVREILPSNKYTKLQPFRGENGSMRQTFTALQGKDGEGRPVFIKVDKVPSTQNGTLLRERGCDTRNEISALLSMGIDEALAHSISPLADFYEQDGTYVSVEPQFTSSKSLRRTVEEDGILEAKEFETVFSQVIPGVRYLIKEKGLFHRDLTPPNILVRRNGSIETRITDLANSSSIAEIRESVMPTAGARFVRDPLLGDTFTGQESKYTEQAEIYALGMNMFYALTGKVPFSYDFLEREGKSTVTGESILSGGLIDKRKHSKTLEGGLKLIPRKARKYSQLIRKCLTLNEAERYNSIDELVEDFDRATKKDSKTKSRLKRFLVGGLFAASLAIPGISYLQTNTEKIVEQKYPVKAEFSGSTLGIDNNLVDINLKVYKRNPYELCKDVEKFLSLGKGDSIEVNVKVKEKPWPNRSHCSIPTFEGKVYFEGYQPIEFAVSAERYDDIGSEGYGWYPYVKMKAPEEDGIYILAAEIYAHDKPDKEGVITALKEIEYLEPGKCLARKRVPIIVGNQKDKVWLRSLELGGYAELPRIETPDYESLQEKLACDVSIPEDGFKTEIRQGNFVNGIFSNLGLPIGEDTTTKTLQFALKNKSGRVIGYYAVPIHREHIVENTFWWELALPTPDFSEKLVGYRKALERNN
ncbi:hypothetical protein HYT57_03500 [Candidatus Woesearchaeota archaeon]|nr:hypothetical protein [Candidatus Woesearchaeota archaeon]